ncbi:hypothetical protein K491DRAFT_716834 [Lophiostoma macrostomum CBS 122681]|uniref:DUF3176 domain containing protein n=1 Tax=Lophiostoma macrostomum CBS 122681 TaxID=1314788 RepID=A0A6A6T3Q3_9PLEO|nr:hypothetical protein K491DRAFT_716834 [Lophiostoma macrostomum CBS 122681]
MYLDTGREVTLESPPLPPPKTDRARFCPICKTDSREQPIHCIRKPEGPLSLSTVPELRVKPPPRSSRPQPPLPALHCDPESRPNVRFRQNHFSPLSPWTKKNETVWDSKSSLGLGILDAPFKPDKSPLTPGAVENAREDADASDSVGPVSNFAQRLKRKLWKYNTSGSVIMKWSLEIISWSVSAVCMAGIIGVLFVYKDKRIPNWPLGLTLNAYISVLSKIASAGLLLPVSEALGQLKWSWFNKGSKKIWDFEIFDNASRGPWGSLLLLVRTKGKSLAALGTAITVFALALDQFFQQVVEYPEHWRVQPGNGTIPRSIGYAPYKAGSDYRADGDVRLDLDSNLQAVTERFFYDNGIAPVPFGKGYRAEVPLSCPNSNCTWPQYETLGFRSECIDITAQLDFRCIYTTLDWVQIPDVDDVTSENVFPNGTSCGWWLRADRPLLMTGYDIDRNTNHSGKILLMRAQPLYDIFTREPIPGYTSSLNNTRNPLSHVLIVSGGDEASIRQNATPVAAHECILSWAVKEILSEYSAGGYTENVQQTIYNSTLGPNPWTTFQIQDASGATVGTNYVYNENISLTCPYGTQYHLDNTTQIMILSLFDDIFPSMYTHAQNLLNETQPLLRYRPQITTNPWLRNMLYNPFLFANISTHMDRMAAAMTNAMRSSADDTVSVVGYAYEKESYVDVRWLWLLLPLALLGLTLIFLLVTIIRSSMEPSVGIYKTSAIAILLYGLPDEMQKKIRSSNEKGTPRTNAKEAKMKWVPKAGWRFSSKTLSPDSGSTNWGRKRDA